MWLFKKKIEERKGPALACLHYGICSKEKCPMWTAFDITILVDGKSQVVKEAKCALAWTPALLVELRQHVVLAIKNKGMDDATDKK